MTTDEEILAGFWAKGKSPMSEHSLQGLITLNEIKELMKLAREDVLIQSNEDWQGIEKYDKKLVEKEKEIQKLKEQLAETGDEGYVSLINQNKKFRDALKEISESDTYDAGELRNQAKKALSGETPGP